MAKTALPSVVLWTLVIFITQASAEEYQVNVELPLSSSQISHSITVPEGEILTVCVVRSSTTATLNVVVKGESNPRKKSALGGIDYLPAEISLIFERSLENQTKCGEFSIIQDGLDEGQETFFLSLSQDNEVKIPGNITVNIDACKQGDIILTKSVWESFSIVEYCKDSTQWVILCDESDMWTMEDATVVCRQAGRSGGEVLHHELGNKIVNVRGMVPQCIGNESHIDDCDNITANECNPVLVDCGLASDGDSNSSGGIWMIIVAVAPPLLLIVLIAVCAIVIRVWRKGTFYRNNSESSHHQQSSIPTHCADLDVPNARYVSVRQSGPDP